MGARSVLKESADLHESGKTADRGKRDPFTDEDRARGRLVQAKKKAQKAAEAQLIVQNAVAQRGGELPEVQIGRIARALRFSKEDIRSMVLVAKENLTAAGQDYVKMHRQAVQTALANGDAKSLEVAVKGSQWAMENISVEGARIVDRGAVGDSGTKILIGIQLGGQNKGAEGTVLEAKVLPQISTGESAQ